VVAIADLEAHGEIELVARRANLVLDLDIVNRRHVGNKLAKSHRHGGALL